jgi:hypothetical protein
MVRIRPNSLEIRIGIQSQLPRHICMYTCKPPDGIHFHEPLTTIRMCGSSLTSKVPRSRNTLAVLYYGEFSRVMMFGMWPGYIHDVNGDSTTLSPLRNPWGSRFSIGLRFARFAAFFCGAAHGSGREIKRKSKTAHRQKSKSPHTHVPVESPSLEVTSFARDFPMLTRLTLTPIHLHDVHPPSSTTPHHPARFRKVL